MTSSATTTTPTDSRPTLPTNQDSDEDELEARDELDEEDLQEYQDNLIEEYELGAQVEGDEEEYEEFDEETETLMAKNLEQEGLRIKIDRLIRDDEPIISCLIIPRKGQSTSNIQSDTQNRGVPFKLIGLDKAGLHLEVEQGKIIQFLKAVFEPTYYEKYSFHLEKDEDDGLPEPLEQASHAVNRLMIKEKEMNKFMQVRKPLRKPLQKTSESFDPSKLTPEDLSLPGKVEPITAKPANPPATQVKTSSKETKPEQKGATESNTSKPTSNPSKPKQTTGGRKPIGEY